MEFKDFIKPELLVLIPVLLGFASQLKNTPAIPDYVIPLVIDFLGIVFAGIYVGATDTSGNLLMSIFTGATQGMLCALAAIGVHQTIKQTLEKN
jgi:hypothetical protein